MVFQKRFKMNAFKKINKYLIVIVSCFMFLFLSICSCTVPKRFQQEPKRTVQKPTFPIENSDLIEVCLKDSLRGQNPFQAIKLEDGNPSVNCIVYETELLSSEKQEGFWTPHRYGSLYYHQWTKSMNVEDLMIPRTNFQREFWKLRIHKDKYGENDGDLWISESEQLLKEISKKDSFEIDSYQLNERDGLYYATISLKCVKEISQEDWNNLKYNIFLKPDILYSETFYGHPSDNIENLAYDLITFQGDEKEEYDGIGFNLSTHSNNVPTLENPIVILKTETFSLPEIPYEDRGFLRNPPPIKQPNWSIHLILNDGADLRKNLYSWSLPIDIAE
jgi:hypothetical protein